MKTMQLESLANELLLDLFEFLNGVHLLRTFHGLNSRFNHLLITHFRHNPLDFHSVSKNDFNIVCQQHLPLIINHLSSLRLSDDDETPQQTHYFFAHNLTLDQFTPLHSLSLSYIYSQQTMDKIIDELGHLTHLRQLSVISCNFRSSYINSIWRLPRLIYCILDSINEVEWIDVPIVESLSLQNLSILYTTFEITALKRLLEHTPSIRQLAVHFTGSLGSQQILLIASSIRKLNLSWENSIDQLENILQYMPDLSHLTVQITGIYVDGYRWEKMITDHLSKLKIFRLLMEFDSDNFIDSEEEIDQILDTFRTYFWLDNHQWFVRCHWEVQLDKKSCFLYTLPFAFPWFVFTTDMRFKSTCSNDHDYYSYDRVHYLSYDFSLSTDFLQLRFPNLHDIGLQLPIADNFWSILPSLDRLTSLIVAVSVEDLFLSQLQLLLDRAPRLYSLYLHKDLTSHVLHLTSKTIGRLYLRLSNPVFNEQRCIALSHSPLGRQCEFLLIEVEHRTDVVYLVNNMKNLRALSIQCKDDAMKNKGYLDSEQSTEDEVVEWLQQRLPLSCSISRDFSDSIKLWIR